MFSYGDISLVGRADSLEKRDVAGTSIRAYLRERVSLNPPKAGDQSSMAMDYMVSEVMRQDVAAVVFILSM